jgi:hypothetical protein
MIYGYAPHLRQPRNACLAGGHNAINPYQDTLTGPAEASTYPLPSKRKQSILSSPTLLLSKKRGPQRQGPQEEENDDPDPLLLCFCNLLNHFG